MTGKEITYYTSDAKELLAHNFEHQKNKHNTRNECLWWNHHSHTIKHTTLQTISIMSINNAKMQQTLMATAQNMVKIHNIELKEQKKDKILINLN